MILAPFKWIVALFFNWSFAVFHDPGWAVVGMSVLLSLLLTPLYIWIERRKNSDKAKGAPMQAEIDKIEAVYTGRERFYYTREIQRRYHYSPWTAMIPTLGLLVQIPFLLAAYHYLSELPVFEGAAFWYIKDLSKPDTVATVAGLPINLLAILMTVINLVSGWRYAESGKPKERIQYMAVAAIFLFLLYSCASSVVLYWTLSNALSFVRSEIFFRRNAASAQHMPFPMENVVSSAKWVCICLLTLVVVVAMDIEVLRASDFDGWPMYALSLYRVAFFGVFAVALIIAGLVWRRFLNGERLPFLFNRIATLIVLSLAIPFLHRFARLPVDESPVISYLHDMGLPFAAILSVLLIGISWRVAFPAGADTRAAADGEGGYGWIGFWAMLGLCAQVLLCGPVCAYASYPEGAREVTLSSLFWQGLCKTAICSAVAGCALRFLPKGFAHLLTLFAVLVFGVFFINGNIVPTDYGVLFQGRYANEKAIDPSVAALAVEALFLSLMPVAAVFVSRMIRQKARIVIWCLAIISVSFFLRMGFAVLKMPALDGSESAVAAGDKLFRFSRNSRNVLYLLLDAYVGQRFGTIIDRSPELKDAFDGFTYYPNTIAVGTFTFANMAAMWGGEEYTPFNIDKSRKLSELYREAGDVFEANVNKAGYRFATSLIGCGYMGRSFEAERTWIEGIYQRPRKRDGVDSRNLGLASLKGNALMCALPLAMRPGIYDSGHWHIAGDSFDPAFDFMEDLVENSEVVDDPKGVFLQIHSEATHPPNLTRVKGQNRKLGADSCFKWSTERVAEWLRWMKENGVYDNTRIVICSDHGSPMNEGGKKNFLDRRYVTNADKMQTAVGAKNDVHKYFALLVTKDFASHGDLKTDLTTKTVSHGAYFAFGNPRFNEPVKEIVSSYVVCPPDWRERNGFVAPMHFRITGNASDGDNWQTIKK